MSEERLALAIGLARQAGALLREGYGKSMHVDRKGVVDLVTEYDVHSEEIILDGLRRAYPGDAVLAEESGASGSGEWRWLVDPLDGTSNFAHGLPIFSVSIACAHNGRTILGVVYDPLRDELFAAGLGQGALLNDQPVSVSATHALDDCLAATSFPYDLRSNPDNNLAQFAAVCLRTHDVRRLGSAAINLAYVAAGRVDAFWGMRLSAWDLAAGLLLVQEAGGRTSRMDGEADPLAEPTSILASNGLLHDSLLEVLAG